MRTEVGLLLPTREAVLYGGSDPAPLLDLAEAAETAGFDSVWAGDSVLARPRLEPLTLLSAVAARTRRVTLGTAVLLLALRPPVLLAHAVATLDRLATGRLVLGVGTAADLPASREEFAAVGVPFEGRVRRLVDCLATCRRLWSGELEPTPHRDGGPPVWIGGSGPLARRRAVEVGDGWFPSGPTPEAYAEGLAHVLEHASATGRPVDELTPAAYLTLAIDADAADAKARLDRYMLDYYGMPLEVMSLFHGCYAGPVEGCGEWLAAWETAGARHLVLRFASADVRPEMEQVASAVLPDLSGVG